MKITNPQIKTKTARFSGSAATVVGIGRSNIPLAEFLIEAGAKVTARDRKPRGELGEAADALEKLGVTEIEALGKTFDPQYHNAVFHVEDEAYGESEIVEVLQKGYIKGDRVLRYAMVKVAN